uniref:Uncharacterized protein n=1 Tax=Parascaris equorum TaxID=6256 RepID=A0A914RYZ8_PAREQ
MGRELREVRDYLKFRSTDSVLFAARLVTVICSLYYVLPIGSHSAQNSAYSKAFAAAAATNALRVHQRVGGIRFTREFLSQVLLEDSCHYLIYSVLFMSTAPVTTLNVEWSAKLAASVSKHNFNISMMRFNFAFLKCDHRFPPSVIVALYWTSSRFRCSPTIVFLLIFFRIVFYQLRVSLEQAVSGPNCPQIFRSFAYGLINLVCRLCPTGA